MKALPPDVVAYKRTPIFTQETVPAALLKHHTTKDGSWGKIKVISGQLEYQILLDPPEEYRLTLELPGIVEPQVPHQVHPLGPVEFYVEFYRVEEQ
ncbi:DUF1971 domain-containing protein [Acaryochloris sp. IP29b_bin.137]|uniref:DUF1971 domain-containing protein n=1 Tax=Acaryochloris sp. IP29b_bin.137 TaxID=2969217 RepID=UPI0026131105|nr:DUF1971 domain-containing protein [Acaryochloris sp. IP29b_bin.137]